jgi:hypothetical protein
VTFPDPRHKNETTKGLILTPNINVSIQEEGKDDAEGPKQIR